MLTYKNLGRLGRFCNALFQIFGTIGIATKSQQSFAFPVFRNYDGERLGSDKDIDCYKHFVNQLPEIPEGVEFIDHPYFWGYSDLNFNTGNWSLNGHFQSERYFEHCRDLILHYGKMVDEPADIDAVAIHCRHGDYDNNYHPIQTKDYYRAALGHMPPTTLLLFSDDLQKASDMMDNIGVEYTTVDKDTYESFKIMKKCKHFITANSSYSLMAAILGNQEGKRVVCPSNWFGPAWGDKGATDYMAKDIYPSGAVVL